MLIRCSILSSKVSSRNFLEVDTYRSRELQDNILSPPILKGLYNFTKNFKMKKKAKLKKNCYNLGIPAISSKLFSRPSK